MNWQMFENAISFVGRNGTDNLLDYLYNNTDFQRAPATAADHDAEPGGLLRHCWKVKERLESLIFQNPDIKMTEKEAERTLKSVIVVSLLHAVGLVNTYKPYMRNVKDEAGNWVSFAAYKKEPELALPGTPEMKSLLILQRCGYQLTFEEAIAIASVTNRECSSNDVYKNHRLAFYLHMADEMAVFLPESTATEQVTQAAPAPQASVPVAQAPAPTPAPVAAQQCYAPQQMVQMPQQCVMPQQAAPQMLPQMPVQQQYPN